MGQHWIFYVHGRKGASRTTLSYKKHQTKRTRKLGNSCTDYWTNSTRGCAHALLVIRILIIICVVFLLESTLCDIMQKSIDTLNHKDIQLFTDMRSFGNWREQINKELRPTSPKYTENEIWQTEFLHKPRNSMTFRKILAQQKPTRINVLPDDKSQATHN